MTRSRRTLVATGAALALAGGALLVGGSGASAATGSPNAPATAGSYYLALGDSVAFGYRESANLPAPDYSDAANFRGYPENVGKALGLRVANASCPGETSSSLIAANVTSNGCENSPGGSAGYRTAYPLHAKYKGTQLTFGLNFLKAHPDTRLVTLMIGANDGFLCQETTSDSCASELQGVLKQVRANVRTILNGVRNEAGYTGQIVIVDYYSLDYRSGLSNFSSKSLNASMYQAAKPYDVRIANGYRAFERAAAQAGGDSCAAGLLTTLTTGGCGVHPSVAGQALLAQSVENAVSR